MSDIIGEMIKAQKDLADVVNDLADLVVKQTDQINELTKCMRVAGDAILKLQAAERDRYKVQIN